MSADMNLKDHIRSIPDFPKPGILFYDISTLLAHAKAWHQTIERMAEMARRHKPDVIAGIESRGFLLAAPLALALGTGFIMLRKKGKLPGITVRHTYALEYGTDTIEIQQDAITKGTRVALVDDLLATGGTMLAAAKLVERLGGQVAGCAFLIELTFLPGRQKLFPRPVHSLIQYATEA
jgi:adenine phosphoribosyltransferase